MMRMYVHVCARFQARLALDKVMHDEAAAAAGAHHSSWKMESRPGMLVAGAVRGLIVLLVLMGNRSSSVKGSPVIGQVLFSLRNFSTSRLSKTKPLFRLTTGCSGTAPLIEQNMLGHDQGRRGLHEGSRWCSIPVFRV